jgi:ribosomal protein S18 acetylase RimI-like enzyme
MRVRSLTATLDASEGASESASRITIRPFRTTDFRAVRRVWKAAGLRISPSDSKKELDRTRKRDPDLFLVALQGKAVVGVVLGRFDGRRGWVNHLAVDPRRQSRGIGTALIRELEDRLRAKGCPKVNLHVESDNHEVVAFYEKLGYSQRGLIYMDKWFRR